MTARSRGYRSPPESDLHVIAERGVDVVVQAQVDDPVVVWVERPAGVFTEEGSKRVDQRFPQVGPVAGRPGADRDMQRADPRVRV
jgi:hypothetical protein